MLNTVVGVFLIMFGVIVLGLLAASAEMETSANNAPNILWPFLGALAVIVLGSAMVIFS